MTEIFTPSVSPAIADCISLDAAAQRIVEGNPRSQPHFVIPESSNSEIDLAIYKLQKFLRSGNICGYSLGDDGSLVPVPKEFWNDNGIQRLDIVDDKIVEDKIYRMNKRGFVKERDSANLYVIETDFARIVECRVHPLPNSRMPAGLLFISNTDSDGNSVPVTYMSIDDAVSAFSEQRKAYFQESNEENKRLSQEKLLSCLETGIINSFHRNGRGFVRPLNPTDWSVEGPILPQVLSGIGFGPLDTPVSEKLRKGNSSWNPFIHIYTDTGPDNGMVIVLTTEVNNVLQEIASEHAPDNSLEYDAGHNSTTNGNIGRPGTHDAELFATLAFKLIFETPGFPKTQADIVRRTLPMYQAARAAAGYKGEPPRDTWAKQRASLLWKRLELGRKVEN